MPRGREQSNLILKGANVVNSGTGDSLTLPRSGWYINSGLVTASAGDLNGGGAAGGAAYAAAAAVVGRLVYVSGVNSDVEAVTLATASSPAKAATHVVVSAISAGGIGRIAQAARISGLNTSTFSAVDQNVFLGSAPTGTLDSALLSGATTHRQLVGQVAVYDSGTGGEIEYLIRAPIAQGQDYLQASAVSAAKIGAGAVIQAKYGNSSISAAHVQMSSLSGLQIKAAGVVSSRIGVDAIGPRHYSNSSISAAHIQMSALSGLQIKASGITSTRVGIAAIGQRHYGNSSISAAHLQMSSISGLQLKASGVTSSRIGLLAIGERHYGASSISGNKIQMSSVSGQAIAVSGIASSRIGVAAVVARHIASGAVSAGKMLIATDLAVVGNAGGSGLERDCLPKLIAADIAAQSGGLSAAANRAGVGFPVSIPDQSVVMGAWFDLQTGWGGGATPPGALSGVHVDFGLSAATTAIDSAGFCNGFPVLSNVATDGTKNPQDFPADQALFSGGTVFVTSNPARPVVYVSATGANLSAVSNGLIRAYVMYITQPVGSAIT